MKSTSTGRRTVAEAAPYFELGGQRCRIVCVDGLLPQHRPIPGSGRIRQCYQPNEVAHFELGAHRWSLVTEPQAPAPGDAAGWAKGKPGPNGAKDSNDKPGTDGADDPKDAVQHPIHTLLTNRELQIVQLICNGLLTKQVSDRLRISEFTVRSYLKTIYCKLGVRSRGAMVYAYARSFASAPQGGPPGDAPGAERQKY